MIQIKRIICNNLRRVGRFIAGRLLPRLAYPVLRGPLFGARFILGSMGGEGGGVSVHLGLVEPAQTRALLGVLKKGQIFYDVGANVGYYTILGARLVGADGRVVAFEPAIRNIEYLHRHCVINRTKNVSFIGAACSSRLGLTRFSLGCDCGTGHLVQEERENQREEACLVATVTIDLVSEGLNMCADVIKIDVEGAELLVLKGAEQILRERKPVLLLSTHSERLRDDCLRYLGGYGYVCKMLSCDNGGSAEYLATVPE